MFFCINYSSRVFSDYCQHYYYSYPYYVLNSSDYQYKLSFDQGNLKLEIVLKDTLPYIPSGSPIILFSSLDDDHTISEAFTNTISRGYTITTVSPSSLDFEERMKRIPAQPLLIARIERDNLISEIRSFGMEVGDWKSDEAVNTALQGG